MARVYFSVMCNARYDTSLGIPDEIVNDEDAVLDYISNNIDSCCVNDLTWISDWDGDEAVYADDISLIENDDGESIGFLENSYISTLKESVCDSPERNIETNDIKELF